MILRLFTFASALSLLLCVATVVLWVRSHCGPVSDLPFEYRTARWHLAVTSKHLAVNNEPQIALAMARRMVAENNRNELQIITENTKYDLDVSISEISSLNDEMATGNETARRIERILNTRASGLSVPYWALIVSSLPLPITWAILLMRRDRLSGCCLKCGYDLRASTVRCPECGTPITSKVEATA
jgi:hypothetical protein